MCLIFFAYKVHPRYRLVLAANRDEFYSRPTNFAEFWPESPQILAGRDLVLGGTWLGITISGRFAAVTNYRDPNAPIGTKSRGDLPKDFLEENTSTENYLSEIERRKNDYSGFNLLAGDLSKSKNELFYFSNHSNSGIKKLSPGIYGLSNHLLNTNWYKVEKGRAKFTRILHQCDTVSADNLFEILGDRSLAPDAKLPDTGVGIERERILSSAFIETKDYGTRSSTILLIENSGLYTFIEKTHSTEAGQKNYEFSIDK